MKRLSPFPALLALCLAALSLSCRSSDSGAMRSAPAARSGRAADVAPMPRALPVRPPCVAPRGSGEPTLELTPEVPCDITFTGQDKSGPQLLEALQNDFDRLSWETFAALNWPANHAGEPDPDQSFGQSPDGDLVWEHWASRWDLYHFEGERPQWGAKPVLPDACQRLGAKANGLGVVTNVGKTPAINDQLGMVEAAGQPFDTGPLIDQHGRYSRFEIRVNQAMFNDIVENGLWTRAGQEAFTQSNRVSFPCSDQEQKGRTGAIMVKASWTLLEEGDDATDFHRRRTLVFTPQVGDKPATCTVENLGLVGFHMAHKSTDTGQWVWSTFEHRRVAPWYDQWKAGQASGAYLYYDADCKDCKPNQVPPRPWDPTTTAKPTQVVRAIHLGEPYLSSASQVNEEAWSQIAERSLWRQYELISTQWPTAKASCDYDPDQAAQPMGAPAPTYLANSTLETYIQQTIIQQTGTSEGRLSEAVPGVTSSCIHCHMSAVLAGGQRPFADFTFVLAGAK